MTKTAIKQFINDKELEAAVSRLRNLNDWRIGKLDVTMDVANIVPSQITKDLDYLLNTIENLKQDLYFNL